ncbi:hypothetical protein N7462_004130 [Penicillium macrosclerotiorum]|uniref:uncharacterized protein n=1 Tax=Penicillium macrosclerotiorum TaxID=303699 RepID=UPI0025466E34|nr:uncharacterized protein N7462_004130 [Penicillium macrosclerotiorum]KAJ5689738.1 hypothetical protein N7462_004130 [Penicillium macrosclerotiorum]
MKVESAESLFQSHIQTVEDCGPNNEISAFISPVWQDSQGEEQKTIDPHNREQASPSKAELYLSPSAPEGLVYLGELASVIRSKNAGPFELTFDVMFDSSVKYDFVKASGVLSAAQFASIYGIDMSSIMAAVWWDPAMAFKITVKRPMVSGSFGETDTHGSCQHFKLLQLLIPAMHENKAT